MNGAPPPQNGDSVGLGEAENLLSYRIPRSQVEQSLFHPHLDNLLYAAEFLVAACVAYPLLAQFLIFHRNSFSSSLAPTPSSSSLPPPPFEHYFYPTPVVVAISVGLYALFELARIDVLSPYSPGQDKGYVVIFSALGLIFSAALFAMEPVGAFAWDPDRGAAAFGSLLGHLARQASPELPMDATRALLTPSPSLMRAVMCLLASVISGLTLASALRFVRSYRLHQEPPQYVVGTVLASSFTHTLKLNCMIIFPALAAMTWTHPLFMLVQQSCGMTEHQAMGTRAAVAIATGLLFLSSCRLILQGYLFTGVLVWHTHKHGARRNSLERAAAAQIIITNCRIITHFVVKSAMQIVAPGVFLLSCGLALGTVWAHPSLMVSPVAQDLLHVVASIGGFCIWWFGLTWVVYVSGGLWLFRTGTLAN